MLMNLTKQSPKLEKGKLNVALVEQLFIDPSARDIEFMFNPQEVSFTRTSTWDFANGTRGLDGIPNVNFSMLQPYTISLNKLIFDTYETKNREEHHSVGNLEAIIENIKRGVHISKIMRKRPPIYQFIWGSERYFYCFMSKLTYTYTMFLSDGTPVRALVDIELQEVNRTLLQMGVDFLKDTPPNPLNPFS